MKNFITKALVLFLLLLSVAAKENNPSLRAESRALHNNAITKKREKGPHRSRSLDLHNNNNKPAVKHQPPRPHHRDLHNTLPNKQPKKPPTRQLQTEPPYIDFCENATPLSIDEVVQGDASEFDASWYAVTGIDGFLAVSACTDDSSLDVETYADVYSGSCDNLIYETSAFGYWDICEMGYFEASADETYYVVVYGFSYDGSGSTFDVKVSEVTEIPNSVCLGATPLELDKVVEGTISEPYGGIWYSLVGTGDDLLITTCTGDSSLDDTPFDSFIDVFARECNDLRWIESDDEGGKCGHGKSAVILPSVEGLTYDILVTEYMGMTGTFGVKISGTP